jgi:uncharacterized membrane protein
MRHLMLGLLLLSAGCATEELADAECPEEGTSLSYQNFGATFMDVWCNECHQPYARQRHGAPGEYNFDKLSGIRQYDARIYARAAASNDSMPPGPDDPPREEREKLAEWLACGAP